MNQPTLVPESGFFRAKMLIGYDGTNFFGWGRQSDVRTVQGEIENALSTLYRGPIETIVAGRTDAGVHATGQVAHADLPEGDFGFEFESLVYRLNRILPEDIRIKSFEKTSDIFHARYGALRRHYIYKIQDGNGVVEPINRFDIAPWYRNLDVDLMNQAAKSLLGVHDFFSYAKYRANATTIRDLQRFEFKRNDDGLIVAHVSADAFCYNMVRALVGTMVYIGEGRFPVSWAREVLEAKERPADSVVFPANGLTFAGVDYVSDSEMQERIQKALARRSLQVDVDEDE
jgi:tRNA pseudouridine38-40 synthase